MYSKIAELEDDKLAERYEKEADGILIFVSPRVNVHLGWASQLTSIQSGLFSAVIATTLSVSFQDLRPNPQETSAFYLRLIYQLLANPDISQLQAPTTLATPPAFSPPLYAIVVNGLLFSSVLCSLTSAALAMLLQEWAHRYRMVTRQPNLAPDQRARVRETFSNFSSGRYILWGTYLMTLLVHISISFFLLGGLIYVFNTNYAVFAFMCITSVFVPLHVAYYTAASIFQSGMLFYGPFSQPALRICLGILYTVTRISSCIPSLRRLSEASRKLYNHLSHSRQGFLKGKEKAIQVVLSDDSTKIDRDVLEWTFNYSVIDADLEKFFAAIPGFFDSKLVTNLQERLSNEFQDKFGRKLDEFLDHTFSSNTFSGLVRGDRLLICLNAARAALGLGAVSRILGGIFDGRWPAALQSIEVGYALKRWGDINVSSHLRRIVARIISRVQVHERDDRWIGLVKDEFGMPDRAFQDHVASGDGISLAILIHIIRQLLHTDFELWEPGILRGLSESNFDIRATLPGQQHEFCTVWDEVVEEARRRGIGSIPILLLEELRDVHTLLHQDTDVSQATYAGPTAASTDDTDILLEPFSYPLCRVVGHPLYSTLQLGRLPVESIALPPPFHVPDAPPPFPTPMHTSYRPASLEGQSVVISPGVPALEMSLVSHMAAVNPHSIPENSPALRQVQKTEITPTSIARTDYLAPTPGAPSSSSSSAARRPSAPPQFPTIFGQATNATSTSIGSAGMYNDNPNPNQPMSAEAQSAPSAPTVDTSSVRREEHEKGPL